MKPQNTSKKYKDSVIFRRLKNLLASHGLEEGVLSASGPDGLPTGSTFVDQQVRQEVTRKEIFAQFPKLQEAFEPLTWSVAEQVSILSKIAKASPEGIEESYNALVQVLASCLDLHWSSQQKFVLLNLLVCSSHQNICATLNSLTLVIQQMKESDGHQEKKYQLVIKLLETQQLNISESYKTLFLCLEALESLNLNLAEQYELLIRIAEKTAMVAPAAYRNLPTAIATLTVSQWEKSETIKFLTAIVEKTGKSSGWAFAAIPSFLKELAEIGARSREWQEALIYAAHQASIFVERTYLPIFKSLLGADGKVENDSYKLDLFALVIEKNEAHFLATQAHMFTALLATRESGWSLADTFQLVTCAHENVENAAVWDCKPFIQAVSIIQSGMPNEGPQNHYRALLTLIRKAKTCFADTVTFLLTVSRVVVAHDNQDIFVLILRLLDHLNDFNRNLVMKLFSRFSGLFQTFAPADCIAEIKFFIRIFKRWPRLGYSILEGVLEAQLMGLVPKNLTDRQDGIFHFIEQTHGFMPKIYQSYQQEHESFSEEFKTLARRAINDDLDLATVAQTIQQQGADYFLAVIQMVSSTSGSSCFGREHQLELMQKMLAAGDLRGHVPAGWRQLQKNFAVAQGSWALKVGTTYDPDGIIRQLIASINSGEQPTTYLLSTLTEAIANYLTAASSQQKQAAKTCLTDCLYRLAAQDDVMQGLLNNNLGNDYHTLLVLRQLFEGRNHLPRLLTRAFARLPRELLIGKGEKKDIANQAKRLVRSLRITWEKSGKSREERVNIFRNILRIYSVRSIEQRILARGDLPTDFKTELSEAVGAVPTLSQKRFIQDILGAPIAAIQNEIAKFEYTETTPINLGLHAVKGSAFVLHSLTAGICIDNNVELWHDANFKLLAMIDESRQQALGYLQVYEAKQAGRCYLTLPGINPTAEFLSTVNVSKFFAKLMRATIALAQDAGLDGVYIPVHSEIHSQLNAMKKEIKKQNYPVKEFSSDGWNRVQTGYQVHEVYVVWERGLD